MIPVTPSIRRIAVAFLGFDPWAALSTTIGTRWVDNGCEVCTDGIHVEGDRCDACEGTAEGAYWLPLDVSAGLEIARRRLSEVGSPYMRVDFMAPELVADRLRALDPEMTAPSTTP